MLPQFANHNIEPLNWLSYNPDLSPIAHLSFMTNYGTNFTFGYGRSRICPQLWTSYKLPMRKINALMNSMHIRMRHGVIGQNLKFLQFTS